MKTVRLFDNGGSRAVRLPKEWVEGVREVEIEREGSKIILRPRKSDLWQVAEECADYEAFPKRLPQSRTGVRVRF